MDEPGRAGVASHARRGLVELAMVFLGVMGAFVVDGLRERHIERTQEVLYLERLATDLRQDSPMIEIAPCAAARSPIGTPSGAARDSVPVHPLHP